MGFSFRACQNSLLIPQSPSIPYAMPNDPRSLSHIPGSFLCMKLPFDVSIYLATKDIHIHPDSRIYQIFK